MAATLTFDKNKYSDVSINWAFFVYFSVMFCLYMNTYIQLFIQIFIMGYVVISKFYNKHYVVRLEKSTIKNLIFFTVWFGGLTLLLFLSTKFWAYSYMPESKTMMGVFREFGIGLAIFLYIDSSKKALSVMHSFVYAAVILGIVATLTTSPSQYFQAGDEGFGQVIGQQRNLIGSVGAILTVICPYLKKYTNLKYGNYLSAFFLILTVITGSRGSLVQLFILFVLIVVIDKNLFQMLYKLLLFVFLGAVVLILLKNVDILYQNIWLRFGEMFTTISGEEIQDASTQGRQFYREIAWNMFLEKPILGWGLDGFWCYLRDFPIYKGYHIKAVYSHCNFSELMANLGIVGLLIWYIPTLYILAKSFKYREHHPLMKILFFLLLSMIILDYARIPWMSHPGAYQYFLVFLLILFISDDVKRTKVLNKIKNEDYQ